MHRFRELERILMGQPKDKPIAIELHQNPDADAMGTGLFLYELTRKLGISASLTHGGFISHPENRAFVRLLGVPLVNYDDVGSKVMPDDFDKFIFVDHHGSNSAWYSEGCIMPQKVLAVIDHHKMNGCDIGDAYVDCREVGAVSTIAAEYFSNGGKVYFRDSEIERLSTGLLLGIRKDTMDLRKGASQADKRMHAYLMKTADRQIIDTIDNLEWTTLWMDCYGKAVSERVTRTGVTVSCVGFVEAEERDVIPTTADYLLRERDVHTVYVIGIRSDGIDISIRTKQPDYDFSSFKRQLPEAQIGARNGTGRIMLPLQNGFREASEGTGMEKILVTDLREMLFAYQK
jgi:nanoRNase/pAp phosphatase (c-di-AMP/oligoRNAs hydrolase)